MKGKEATRLGRAFFTRHDVLAISRELLGMYLVTNFNGLYTAGRIVEAEAYRGPDDKASHAYKNRYTERTRVMYSVGGFAYVYLCYGIHHLFNIVTAGEGCPHAVLIRGIEPIDNVELMLQRRSLARPVARLTAGPGVLSQALGITTANSGIDLAAPDSPIWLEHRGEPSVQENDIEAGPRIGVAYAEECAAWPWRFYLKGNPWVSKG
ncbi:MAG: DNA-3-methyladenine glycosylase [Lewinellaceae bacterium]|nr:DNA-3-methyladenine glycosylase [Lewinellaceae bacterium]